MAYITKKSIKPEMLGDVGFTLDEKPEYITKKEKKKEWITKKKEKKVFIKLRDDPNPKTKDWITLKKKEFPKIGKDY